MTPSRLAALFVAGIVSFVATTATAEPTAPERALKLHDEAKTLYAKGKYNDAVERLKLAIELDPEAKVLYYNLGLLEEKLGHIDAALAYFRRCLELEQSHEERVRLAKVIKRLEGARAYVDWSDNAQTAPVIIRTSSERSSRGRQSAPLLPWVYVAGATSVAAALVGIGLAVRAGDVDPGNTPTTAPGVTPEQLQEASAEAHGLAIGADVSFGIGAGALATAVVLAVVSAHGISTEVARDHTLSVGATGGLWTWRF